MRHRVKALVTTASVAGLLLTGATPGHATTLSSTGDNSQSRTAIAQAPAALYDGQTLFAGLMLGYGPVAEQYPELAAGGIHTTDPQAATQFVEQVTATVRDLDPTFFDTFSQAITSGDRVQIDQALRSAGDLLIAALTELDGSLQGGDPGINSAVAVAIAIAVVAVVTIAGAVNTVVTFNVAYTVDTVETMTKSPTPTPPEPESMPRIDHEKRVDQIAEALAG